MLSKLLWTKTATLGAFAFFLCAVASAQDARIERRPPDADPTYRISGTVVNALTGAPLSQALVALTDIAHQANALSVLTTEDGRFAFTSLKRGKFSLFGARRGYIRALYEQHEQFSTAIVTGPGLDSENLVMPLMPLAFLGGKVFDETDEPVRHANVMLYAENHRGGVNRVQPVNSDMTDDQGYYEFAALAPGNYFVSVAAKPWYAVHSISSAIRAGNSPAGAASYLDVAYPSTYYNGATDSQGASPIAIHGGDRVQADLHLNPVPVLHLTFRGTADPQRGIFMPALMKRAFDTFENAIGEGMQEISPGVYEITGVPAGKYTVQTRDPQNGQVSQTTEVTLNKDGQELDMAQGDPNATVRLSVVMPRDEPLPKQLNIGIQDSRGALYGFNPVDASGHAIVEGVPPGKYTILVGAYDKRYSVTRAVFAGVEVPTQEFAVPPGASMDGSIYLTAGVVTVEGFVKRGSKPASGVMVALVPKDPQTHGDMFRRDQSDSDGSFVLRGVIPGIYTLVAVEDAWGFAWNQPNVLNRYIQHGQNLTVGPLMTNTVHLPEGVQVQPR